MIYFISLSILTAKKTYRIIKYSFNSISDLSFIYRSLIKTTLHLSYTDVAYCKI